MTKSNFEKIVMTSF